MYNPSEELLEYINNTVNLLEYASQSFEFEQRGRGEYFARCPKHTDNTPSLSITPETNKYFCFGCGRGGGIVKWLMDYEGLSFEQAVDKGSKLAHINPASLCHSETISFLRSVRKLNNQQKEHTNHEILNPSILDTYSHAPVPEWIEEGIEQKTLDFFGVRVDEKGNRIVYPVYDARGRLINIKGRTRYPLNSGIKIAKYINYYPVGTVDYFQSLERTYPYIKEKGEVIVFESIKSVMKAFQWGYKNCVSAEKHTLTDEQIRLLIKMQASVVLAYDKDVDYKEASVKRDVARLRRMTNLYTIIDTNNLLGKPFEIINGEKKKNKNAPVDCGKDIWIKLYEDRRKVV